MLLLTHPREVTVANPTANAVINSPYFAEEIHSPFAVEHADAFDLTMSTSNDAGAAGKAPMRTEGPNANGGGYRHGGTNIVTVEPPKQSDLQVSHLSRPFLL